jgi:hypothetical protein
MSDSEHTLRMVQYLILLDIHVVVVVGCDRYTAGCRLNPPRARRNCHSFEFMLVRVVLLLILFLIECLGSSSFRELIRSDVLSSWMTNGWGRKRNEWGKSNQLHVVP